MVDIGTNEVEEALGSLGPEVAYGSRPLKTVQVLVRQFVVKCKTTVWKLCEIIFS
jgi:hypothetical protein